MFFAANQQRLPVALEALVSSKYHIETGIPEGKRVDTHRNELGRAKVTCHAPELAWLANAEVLGARTNYVAWAKPYGTVIHREVVAA